MAHSRASLEGSTELSAAPRDDEQYRALCLPALLALLSGLASPLVFVSYVFWTLPLLAIVLGAYGLRQIRRYAPTLTGRTAALCGIVLALFFGTAGVAYDTAHRLSLESEARRVAEYWVNLLRTGKLREAHQLTLDPGSRALPQSDLEAVYVEREELGTNFTTFETADMVKRIVETPQSAAISLWELKNLREGEMSTSAMADFLVAHAADQSDKDYLFELVLYRLKNEKGDITWRVLIELLPAPLPPEVARARKAD